MTHIGDKAPFDLHHRQPGIGRGYPDIGAGGDLQPAAEAGAVDCRNHRHRELAPLQRELLKPVGIAVGAFGQRGFGDKAVAGHRGKIEPGAERPPLPRENYCTQPRPAIKRAARSEQGIDHGPVDRIELIGPGQPNLGNARIVDRDRNPVPILPSAPHRLRPLHMPAGWVPPSGRVRPAPNRRARPEGREHGWARSARQQGHRPRRERCG